MFGGLNYSDVQVAAAEALISILKTEAVPLIEKQLADATPETREDLLMAIASLDGRWFMATKTPDSPFCWPPGAALVKARLPTFGSSQSMPS